MSGCLMILAPGAFLGGVVLFSVFYIYFGPGNPLVGLAVGVALAAACYWLIRRFPFLVGGGGGLKSKLAAGGLAQMIHYSADPNATRNAIVKVMIWLLIAVGAIPTLYCALAIAVLTKEGRFSTDMNAASLGCGVAGYLTYRCWKLLPKADPK